MQGCGGVVDVSHSGCRTVAAPRLLQESAMQGDELPATAEQPDQLSEEAAESFQSLDEYGGYPYDPEGYVSSACMAHLNIR